VSVWQEKKCPEYRKRKTMLVLEKGFNDSIIINNNREIIRCKVTTLKSISRVVQDFKISNNRTKIRLINAKDDETILIRQKHKRKRYKYIYLNKTNKKYYVEYSDCPREYY
jgi:hypothetical protein